MRGEIYWIDDKEGAFPVGAIKKQIEEVCDAEVRLIVAKQETLDDDVLAPLAAGAVVKLIVLDYWLGNLPKGNDATAGTKTEYGSAWAATLRAKHPELPIVGVTSETIDDVPDSQKSQFLELLNRDKIFEGKHDLDIKALVDGFPLVYGLWTASRKKPDVPARLPEKVQIDSHSIVGLLAPPASTADYLESVLPEFAKQHWDQETPHEFSRWILEVLFGRPGFLGDALEVATLVGLTEKGFTRVAESFNGALYAGVFSSADRPLWWVDRIRPIVISIVGEQLSGPIRNHRELLLSKILGHADSVLMSGAYPSGDIAAIPDCVAFADEQRVMRDRIQARSVDTVIDPLESPPIGFEARRLWAPAK